VDVPVGREQAAQAGAREPRLPGGRGPMRGRGLGRPAAAGIDPPGRTF